MKFGKENEDQIGLLGLFSGLTAPILCPPSKLSRSPSVRHRHLCKNDLNLSVIKQNRIAFTNPWAPSPNACDKRSKLDIRPMHPIRFLVYDCHSGEWKRILMQFSIRYRYYTWLRANSDSTMLNNIVDNIEQCGQHNIVQGCFEQPWTGWAFFAVYRVTFRILLKNCGKLR